MSGGPSKPSPHTKPKGPSVPSNPSLRSNFDIIKRNYRDIFDYEMRNKFPIPYKHSLEEFMDKLFSGSDCKKIITDIFKIF